MIESYPIYILADDQIVFPEGKKDLGHCEFWEETVHKIVATLFHVPAARLINLPYCQRRARICLGKVYYGEKFDRSLLVKIKKAVQEKKLEFAFDDHERRLVHDVRMFDRIIAPCQ